jgi:hypothetical protein
VGSGRFLQFSLTVFGPRTLARGLFLKTYRS